MSVTSGFYDSLNGDRKYGILELSSIFDGIISDGVYSSIGNHFIVRAAEPKSMQIIVGSGRAWFNHSWILNDVDYPLNVNDADAVLSRIDTVVLEIDRGDTIRAARIFIKDGTPSSDPYPAILTNNRTMTQVPLAYISVLSKANKIYASDITNNVGTDLCPFVTGVLTSVSTNDLVTQWEEEFENLFAQLRIQIDQVVQGSVPDGAVSSTYRVNLTSDAWIQDANGYHKSISVPGVLSSDEPIVDIDFTWNPDWATGIEIQEAWSHIYKITAQTGSITVYSEDIPPFWIPLKLRCIRK